jgi:hypothetical protein
VIESKSVPRERLSLPIQQSAFLEFTGKKSPKAKDRFTLNSAPFLAIAGLWREGKAGAPARLYDADDVTGARRGAFSLASSGCAEAKGLGRLDLPDEGATASRSAGLTDR